MKVTATWVAVAALVLSTSALGDTVSVHWDASIFAPAGSQPVSFSMDAGAHSHSGSAGRYQGTVNAFTGALTAGTFTDSTSDFWAYCSDLTQTLSGGNTYLYSVGTPAARTLDWLGAVNAVLGGGVYSWLHPGNAATSAAIQLGIWESLYDASGWDLAAGNFRASGFDSATATQYATFRAAVENAATPDLSSLYVLQLVNADAQDVISGRRIPEPGSMLLLMSAAALAGWSLRRNR